jgi:hypothetical protein
MQGPPPWGPRTSDVGHMDRLARINAWANRQYGGGGVDLSRVRIKSAADLNKLSRVLY